VRLWSFVEGASRMGTIGPVATPRLSDRRLRLLRQTNQWLHRPGRASALDVVRTLMGVQAQDRAAAALALRARSEGLTAARVARALEEDRSIFRTWAMRGTLHLIATEDFGWIVPLTAERSLRGAHRRLAQLGVTGDQPEKGVRRIERMLASQGPLTRTGIAQRLRRSGIRTEGQAGIHLIRLAALEGLVCYGFDKDGDPTFALVRDWLGVGVPPRWNREEALGEMASRYLASHAPARPDDFATWSGLAAPDVRLAWERISARLVEVRSRGGSLWMLRSSMDEPPDGVIRLVPAFDPFLLGWKGRHLTLPERHEREVFPGGGLLRPTVLLDGRAVGTWALARRRDPPVVTVRPFARLGPAARDALEDEVGDIGRFLGRPARLALD
jgi:hypothetical protein